MTILVRDACRRQQDHARGIKDNEIVRSNKRLAVWESV